LSGTELKEKTYDEVAVLYGHLWTQRKILETGLATGTIYIIGRDKSRSRSDPLGLGTFTRDYEVMLASSSSTASPAATDFAQINGATRPLAQGYLFSRQFLTYCTALLRSPPTTQVDNQDLLNPFGNHPEEPHIENGGAAEMVHLGSIRSSLARDLGIYDEGLATILLSQLNALGLCTIGHQALVRDEDVRDGDKWMSFGLPLLMDASPTIEILITAIEVLLDDVDLSLNEQALLLLETRAWPSLLCSPYSLERVTGAVTAWVMHEVSTAVSFKQISLRIRITIYFRSSRSTQAATNLFLVYGKRPRVSRGIKVHPLCHCTRKTEGDYWHNTPNLGFLPFTIKMRTCEITHHPAARL
jgi:hypothetical protein